MTVFLRTCALLSGVSLAGSAQAANQPAVFTNGQQDSLTSNTTVNVTHNLSSGGSAVAPRAIIFWTGWYGTSNGETAMGVGFWADNDAAADTQRSVAFGAFPYEGAGHGNGSRRIMSDTNAIMAMQGDGDLRFQANVSAVSTTTFTLSFTDSDAQARPIHWLAIGGSKIKTKLVDWTLSTHATDTSIVQDVTTIGFEPNVCFHLATGPSYTSSTAFGAVQDHAALSIGVNDRGLRQWTVQHQVDDRDVDTDPTIAYRMQLTDQILVWGSGSGANWTKKVAVTALRTDGFTITQTGQAANQLGSASRVISLCLQNVNAFAGSFDKKNTAGAGTDEVNMSPAAAAFTPGAVLLASNMSTGVTFTSGARLGLGSYATTESALICTNQHNVDPAVSFTSSSSTKMFLIDDGDDGTNESQADFSSMDSDGFTVSWSASAAIATKIMYLGLATPSATDVKLASFDATTGPRGRTFRWQTGFESNNLGFHIHEERDRTRRRLTDGLIAGSGLMVGGGQPVLAGQTYQWQTGPAAPGARYWLEEVNLHGQPTMHGPFLATEAAGTETDAISSALLVDLGRDDLPRQGQPGAGEVLNARGDALPRPGRLRAPDDLAARPGLKLMVRQDGFFRMTADRLTAAGLDPTVDPRRLRLFANGYEVRMRVTGEDDGRFDPSDAVEFYGISQDTLSTGARTYWLAAVDGPRARLAEEAGVAHRPARVATFPFTVQDQPRSLYVPALLNGEDGNFFGPIISDTAVDRRVAVHHLADGAGPAELRVRLQGLSQAGHRVAVSLNGQVLGHAAFQGRAAHEAFFPVPATALVNGDNQVALSTASAEDMVAFDRLRLTYPHGLVSDEDAQRVVLPPRRGVKLDGFSGEGVRAFDVTYPDAVTELPVTRRRQGDLVSASIAPLRDGGTVLFVGERRVRHDLALVRNEPSRWRGAYQGADLYIITHASLAPAVEPLRRLREQQGLVVQVIDVQDLYDEFSHGERDAHAIRDFLRTAHRTFTRRPRFVLLVGDASFDPRDHLGLGDHDLVPTKLVDTWPLETASDDWFVDLHDQGLPEIGIGRLPARTLEGARAIVDKIVRHQTADPRGTDALVVGDRSTGGADFADAARKTAEALSTSMPVNMRLRGETLSPSQPATLLDALRAGPLLVQYFGHGSVNLWNGALDVSTVNQFDNHDRLSLVVSMTCLNGFFQDARQTTLAEALLAAPNGGAFAVWASSGFTEFDTHQALGDTFVRGVLHEGLTLGEAARQAKAAISDPDVRRTWVLFGDPSHTVTATARLEGPGGAPVGCAVARGQSDAGMLGLLVVPALLLLRRRRR